MGHCDKISHDAAVDSCSGVWWPQGSLAWIPMDSRAGDGPGKGRYYRAQASLGWEHSLGEGEWLFPCVAEQEEEPRCLISRLKTDHGVSQAPPGSARG